uniref:Uncharacterized protein n=1 Tax=viral metagenome TaxID=1070528 RepID=A0A6M3IUA2_9ZZZZ
MAGIGKWLIGWYVKKYHPDEWARITTEELTPKREAELSINYWQQVRTRAGTKDWQFFEGIMFRSLLAMETVDVWKCKTMEEFAAIRGAREWILDYLETINGAQARLDALREKEHGSPFPDEYQEQ